MTLQVLLSAMYLADYSFIDKLNIKSDCIIINQCDRNEERFIGGCDDPLGRNVLFLSNTDRGLSKSRNLAIRNADREVCILCDNDVHFEEGYEKIITSAFEEKPDADIIVFFIKRPERSVPVMNRFAPLGYLKSMKIFSPEMAFRRTSLIEHGLYMNESFGAGAKYGMGEENIFLFNALKKGMKVYYCPMQIAHLEENESTWFKGYTDKFFTDRGAGYYAMSERWYALLILQFALRKRKLYQGDNTMLHAIKVMFAGARQYRDEC